MTSWQSSDSRSTRQAGAAGNVSWPMPSRPDKSPDTNLRCGRESRSQRQLIAACAPRALSHYSNDNTSTASSITSTVVPVAKQIRTYSRRMTAPPFAGNRAVARLGSARGPSGKYRHPSYHAQFRLEASIIVDALRDRLMTPVGRKPTGQFDFFWGTSTATIGCGGLTCFIKSLFHWPSTLKCASAPSSTASMSM